jgi:hypothetical protein
MEAVEAAVSMEAAAEGMAVSRLDRKAHGMAAEAAKDPMIPASRVANHQSIIV